VLAAMAALALSTAGCGRKKPPRTPDDVALDGANHRRTSDRGATATNADRSGDDLERALGVDPVYFEFDSAELSPHGRDELTQVASWMQRHPGSKLHIEGHTDDQGTTEYNLALGERRAEAISEYLSRLGVETARLDTISYGEERPAVEGEDEAARAKNRRGAVAVQH